MRPSLTRIEYDSLFNPRPTRDGRATRRDRARGAGGSGDARPAPRPSPASEFRFRNRTIDYTLHVTTTRHSTVVLVDGSAGHSESCPPLALTCSRQLPTADRRATGEAEGREPHPGLEPGGRAGSVRGCAAPRRAAQPSINGHRSSRPHRHGMPLVSSGPARSHILSSLPTCMLHCRQPICISSRPPVRAARRAPSAAAPLGRSAAAGRRRPPARPSPAKRAPRCCCPLLGPPPHPSSCPLHV